MSTNIMAALSVTVAAALLIVLVGYLRYLTASLRRTRNGLGGALAIATTIRQDCESIVAGVGALNQNLTAAATGLGSATAAAQRAARPAGVAPTAQSTIPAQRGPSHHAEPRPSARWEDQNGAPESPPTPEPASAARPTRPLRLREPSAPVEIRRQFRVRGGADDS